MCIQNTVFHLEYCLHTLTWTRTGFGNPTLRLSVTRQTSTQQSQTREAIAMFYVQEQVNENERWALGIGWSWRVLLPTERGHFTGGGGDDGINPSPANLHHSLAHFITSSTSATSNPNTSSPSSTHKAPGTSDGSPGSIVPASDSDPALPADNRWAWCTQWEVVLDSDCDADGWQYANAWPKKGKGGWAAGGRGVYVRRRRWVKWRCWFGSSSSSSSSSRSETGGAGGVAATTATTRSPVTESTTPPPPHPPAAGVVSGQRMMTESLVRHAVTLHPHLSSSLTPDHAEELNARGCNSVQEVVHILSRGVLAPHPPSGSAGLTDPSPSQSIHITQETGNNVSADDNKNETVKTEEESPFGPEQPFGLIVDSDLFGTSAPTAAEADVANENTSAPESSHTSHLQGGGYDGGDVPPAMCANPFEDAEILEDSEQFEDVEEFGISDDNDFPSGPSISTLTLQDSGLYQLSRAVTDEDEGDDDPWSLSPFGREEVTEKGKGKKDDEKAAEGSQVRGCVRDVNAECTIRCETAKASIADSTEIAVGSLGSSDALAAPENRRPGEAPGVSSKNLEMDTLLDGILQDTEEMMSDLETQKRITESRNSRDPPPSFLSSIFAGMKSHVSAEPKLTEHTLNSQPSTSSSSVQANASDRDKLLGALTRRTADEVRAKYGRPRKEPSSAASTELTNQMSGNRDKLVERGQRLAHLTDQSSELESDAQVFSELAKKLNQQQKSWFS